MCVVQCSKCSKLTLIYRLGPATAAALFKGAHVHIRQQYGFSSWDLAGSYEAVMFIIFVVVNIV